MMIWDFLDGVIWRTAFGVSGFHAESAEEIAEAVINEFDRVQ